MSGHCKDTKFIARNKDFWSAWHEPSAEGFILVETSEHPVINHSNAVCGKIVAKAKNLQIAWLKYKFTDEALMRSYSTSSVFVEFTRPNLFVMFWFLLRSIFYYIWHILLMNKLSSFSYKGINYGDFIYDGYLAGFSMATLHRFDFRIVKMFFILLLRDRQAREVLAGHNIKALLVAHYIGLDAGVLSRVAMQRDIPVYWKGGGHEIFCLSLFNNLDEIYDHPLRPTAKEVDILVNKFKEKVELDFKDFIDQVNNPYYGALSVAYNNVIISDVSREQFLKKMGLDDKPIIFIMLHAFNDFPHSHFKKMLFKDYYDWFDQTLKFARADKSKNWVFKEHPANAFYPTNDVDLNKIMRKLPAHIKYVSCNSDITAATVLNVADAIVTCLGTAGVEMPALRGIPSIIAGDSFYTGFGFTIEPGTKREYFNVLKEFSPRRLTAEQQLGAKCCYLYLKKYSSMPFAAGPAITYEESKAIEKLKEIYAGRIQESYNKNNSLIYQQFNEYVNEVKKHNFKKLLRVAFE